MARYPMLTKAFFIAFLLVCMPLQADLNFQTLSVIALFYQEQEEGVEPYTSRYLIKNNELRIDDGYDDDDFLLFDMTTGVVQSINRLEKTVVVLNNKQQLLALPDHLVVSVKHENQLQLPLIEKRKPQSYSLFANDVRCLEFGSVKGLFDNAVEVLKSYQLSLAVNNLPGLEYTPKEYQTDCYLANNIYASARYLDHGLPIIMHWENGLERFLLNYKAGYQVKASLFDVPEGYQSYTPQEKRSGQ